MLATAHGAHPLASSVRVMASAHRGSLRSAESGGPHRREATDRPPDVVPTHREEYTVTGVREYTPCPKGTWADHVTEAIEMLRPVLDEEMDPSDRVVFIDNLYDDMCDWHLLAVMFMFTGFASGMGIHAEELHEASKSLREREAETLSIPHP